jgi:predicted dehydrogenase
VAVRFGVVGTAYWAREVHIPGLRARPDVQLVGIWGRNVETARAVAGPIGITPFARFEEMLEVVDAVSIAVPPDIQARLALIAANAGKHLLLEKPVSTVLKTAEDVAEAVSRNRLASVVFLMRRFIPEIEDVVQRASQQVWRHAYIRVHSTALSAASPFANSVWRQAVGAELWDIGPHVLSILDPILGPIVSVDASRGPDGYTRFSTIHLRGSTANVSLTLRAKPADAGTEYRFASDLGELTLPEPSFSRPEVFAGAVGELVSNITRREHMHRCNVDFGTDVVRVLAAAELSIEQGRPVQIRAST